VNSTLTSKTSRLGLRGEEAAAHYLEKQGLKVVGKHFQTRWGEIDLVCREHDAWVFVEVKTRTRASEPGALEAMTSAKQKRLVMAALSYLKKHGLKGQGLRFDVVAIEAGRIQWIPGAFEPAQQYTY